MLTILLENLRKVSQETQCYHPNQMPLDSVRIERITLKDLPALAAAAVDGAAPGTFIPITKHRAIAHTFNPYAAPDDVALLLAKEGDRNVGYFGLMPVMLQYEGNLHKVHWLTTWSVDKDYLGKGLGSRLMEAALALDVDLAIVGSKPARRVSAKYGFHEVKPLDYVQIDLGLAGRYNPISLLLRSLRKLLSIVGLKLSIERLDRAVARGFDFVLAPLLRPLFYALLLRRVTQAAKNARTVQAAKVSEAPTSHSHMGFYRGAEVVNWMLAHPWVLPTGQSQSERLDYEFTDARPEFEITGWRVLPLREGEGQSPSRAERGKAIPNPLGYACFQRSVISGRRTLKVLDFHFAPSTPADLLAATALEQGRRLKADVIEGPAELAAPLGGWLGRALVRRRQRTLQVHPRAADSPLGRAWPPIEQTYCDGDMAFT